MSSRRAAGRGRPPHELGRQAGGAGAAASASTCSRPGEPERASPSPRRTAQTGGAARPAPPGRFARSALPHRPPSDCVELRAAPADAWTTMTLRLWASTSWSSRAMRRARAPWRAAPPARACAGPCPARRVAGGELVGADHPPDQPRADTEDEKGKKMSFGVSTMMRYGDHHGRSDPEREYAGPPGHVPAGGVPGAITSIRTGAVIMFGGCVSQMAMTVKPPVVGQHRDERLESDATGTTARSPLSPRFEQQSGSSRSAVGPQIDQRQRRPEAPPPAAGRGTRQLRSLSPAEPASAAVGVLRGRQRCPAA